MSANLRDTVRAYIESLSEHRPSDVEEAIALTALGKLVVREGEILKERRKNEVTATPQDVQSKLDAATAALSKTTLSWPQMLRRYGSDPASWPAATQWQVALTALASAKNEAGQLLAPPSPPAPSGTLRSKIDYGTGDFSQWSDIQDHTTSCAPPATPCVDSSGFQWGIASILTNPANPANPAGYCGEYFLPPAVSGQTAGTAAFANVRGEYPLQHPDEYYGVSFYFPSGQNPPTTFYGTNILQFNKALPGDPMFDTNSSEPVMLQYIGEGTGDNERVILLIQSGVWQSLSQVSDWYSGLPSWENDPGGEPARYIGTNPFPAGGFHAVPHPMFSYDQWTNIILHVYWSAGTDGFVEAWCKRPGVDSNYVQTVARTTGFPTLDYYGPAGPDSIAGYPKYHNVGNYSGQFQAPGNALYNGMFCAGSTFDVIAAALG